MTRFLEASQDYSLFFCEPIQIYLFVDYRNMRYVNIISKSVVFLLSAWAICAALTAFFGVTIYFPFSIAEEGEIPQHRWQSVRIGVALTFSYYGIIYLFNGSKAAYPIDFLKVFLFMLCFSGVFLFTRSGVESSEYLILLFWFMCATAMHLASRPQFKRYFSKR